MSPKNKRHTVSITRNENQSTERLNFKESLNPAHDIAFLFSLCARGTCS